MPILVLALPSVVFLLTSFVVSQLRIHWRMLDFKREQLAEVRRSLRKLLDTSPQQLTQEEMARIEFLQNLEARTASLPEWPFGWRAMLGAVLTSFAAVFPMVLDVVGLLKP